MTAAWVPLMRFCAVALLAYALAGCTTSLFGDARRQAEEAKNIPPVNYKADLVAFMRAYLNDPTNIRNAAISQPTLRSVGPLDRYVLCLRFNAKNSSGQYAGVKDSVAVFISGKFDRLIEPRPEAEADKPLRDFCAGATYQPFPELEHISR